MRTIRSAIFLLLVTVNLLPSLLGAAATIPGVYGSTPRILPTVTKGQLPVLKPDGIVNGALTPVSSDNQMTIYQTQPKAYLDWSSFNIGEKASVYFNQQGNTSWAALNRIWDKDPSQIYGTLTADGRVLLINQNGIIFGPKSQINVNSLVASSLNLSVDNFLAGTLKFNREQGFINGVADTFYDLSNLPGTTANPGLISNTGSIVTSSLGSVFLLGPYVENKSVEYEPGKYSPGSIVSPMGQIALGAGTDIEIVSAGQAYLVEVNGSLHGMVGETRSNSAIKINNSPNGYIALNGLGGLLAADEGLVGMYGNIVNHSGVIRSVTAVQRGGHVELFASDAIVTGPGSLISLPVSESSDRIISDTAQSTVVFSGLDPDPLHSSRPASYPALIDHEGAIYAPSGYVSLNATNRIYMGSGSRIDVSGLWVDKSSPSLLKVTLNTANLRDDVAQKGGLLQGQTIGISSIGGSTIGDVSGAFSNESRTAVEAHTTGGSVYATVAGSSSAGTPNDIIMREGAFVNISGGGFRYGAGALDTTKLVSGNKVYDISNASSSLRYDSILNYQKFVNERFGTTREFRGVYYGGAVPVRQYVPAYTVGSDAGTLSLQARQVILDGTILGNVTNGFQQVLAADPTNAAGMKAAFGYVEAQGGKLLIGGYDAEGSSTVNSANADSYSFGTESVTVSPQVAPLSSWQPTGADGSLAALPASYFSVLSNGTQVPKTTLSASILTNAGLGTLELAANRAVVLEKGAQVTLVPGGTFGIRAGRIEDYGAVTVRGGDIKLSVETNVTTYARPDSDGNPTNPDYAPINQVIYLADGSALSTAGQRIDNTAASVAGATPLAHLDGGSITIQDKTISGKGVVVSPGALIDVGGGYAISASGKVAGGNAGSLALQGYSLLVAGDLRALSVVGNAGGSLTMTAGTVNIASSAASIPLGLAADSALPAGLVIGADQLAGTGFTNIALNSVNDLVMEGGTLGPSLAKLAKPVPAGKSKTVYGIFSATPAVSETLFATADLIGSSSVALQAGSGVNVSLTPAGDEPGQQLAVSNAIARATVASGARIETGPGGTIDLAAPNIDIAGSLNAPSGTINATAAVNLTLERGGRIRAVGYNKAGTSAFLKGLPVQATPKAAGKVTLTAGGGGSGDLILSEGSSISVSGSPSMRTMVLGDDGTISYVTDASQPGSIFLKAPGEISLKGELTARAAIAGLAGGTLSVTKSDLSGILSISTDDLIRFRDNGFDALTLASYGTLSLSNPTGAGQIAFGRSVTLDAPIITGSGSIALKAPWVKVQAVAITNLSGGLANYTPPGYSSAAPGSASIQLSGTWLDVTGNVVFSGFGSVYLGAQRDITFTDLKYGTSYTGLLAVSGDLTLQAARVYPTTNSRFSPSNGDESNPNGGIVAAGKVTILPSGTVVSGPVYSAGGSLTVTSLGAGIEQQGVIAAPMGNISLYSPRGRIFLGAGSVTTTRGEAAVAYGAYDSTLGDYVWGITDKTGASVQVESTPSKSISFKASNGEVIAQNGAIIDVSGGGAIFTSQFQSSYAGTNAPLNSSTWVIVPDNSVVLPGNAVYLEGIKGLPAGTYSLLPAVYYLDSDTNKENPFLTSYALLPGAMIVTNLGTTVSANRASLTSDGYPIVAGYLTTMGTAIGSPQMSCFKVQAASEVLAQGTFVTASLEAGSAGATAIVGRTTIVSGTVRASALAGYSGGSISLSGTNVVVQQTGVSLPAGFGFGTSIDPDLRDKLTIAASSISDQGFRTIGLGVDENGNTAATTLWVKPGIRLQAENIILGASDFITVGAGAQILAIAAPGSTGRAIFRTSPGGIAILTVEANAVVHASNGITLGTANIAIDPTATFDHTSLTLEGSMITFYNPADSSTKPSSTGLVLTPTQWAGLAKFFDSITLDSGSDLVFNGNFGSDEESRVLAAISDTLTLDAARITQSESGSPVFLSAQTIVLQNTHSERSSSVAERSGGITFQAQEMQVGGGNILFDGFSSVNLNALNNTTFVGAGSILRTGGADLNISTARVTASYLTSSGTYVAPSLTVDSGTGKVAFLSSGGRAGTDTTPGGNLKITAGTIDVFTTIELPSGLMDFTAREGDITLGEGGKLLAYGTASAPGGTVSLTNTGDGAINLLTGSKIDVSAGSQGDAGSIKLYAPGKGVVGDAGAYTFSAELIGRANGGKGGSFSIVTNTLDIVTVNSVATNLLSAWNKNLSDGGFRGSLNMEAKTGNIMVAGETMSGQSVVITADGGNITVDGGIAVNGGDASVTLNARNDLAVNGTITARKANGDGGSVYLNAGHVDGSNNGIGMLAIADEASIDVSGAGTDSPGGTLYLRAYRNDNETDATKKSNMSLGAGTVTGASAVFAETVKVYQAATANVGAYSNYEFTPASVASSLRNASGDVQQVTTLAGIEIQRTGDLNFNTDWDIQSLQSSRQLGVLTLRATGALNINANLVDHPTNLGTLLSTNASRSWGFNLVAGADLTSADFMGVGRAATQGKLTISSATSPKVVYTEKGIIRFASAGDTVIDKGPNGLYMIAYNASTMPYSLATYSGTIYGNVGGSLSILPGGVIQSATGDINIRTAGDLNLETSTSGSQPYLGTIRTTGERGVKANGTRYGQIEYWGYSGGGSISLDVGGDVNGGYDPNAWLTTKTTSVVSYLFPSYVPAGTNVMTTEGIAAMGGGSVYVRSGGSFTGQIGTFGEGNLSIYSGGDIQGRFLVKQGTGVLSAMGNFGSPTALQLIEMGDAHVSVLARGSINIGAILNPALATSHTSFAGPTYWDNQYSSSSSVSLVAATGDVNIEGSIDEARYGKVDDLNLDKKTVLYNASNQRTRYLPPSVSVSAGRDINIQGGAYVLLPSSSGNLSLGAGRDIVFSGGASMIVSDVDPTVIYVPRTKLSTSFQPDIWLPAGHDEAVHTVYSTSGVVSFLHSGDTVPVTITAGRNIDDMNITVPKAAVVTAGGDINDLWLTGQNLIAGDVTRIVAWGDILYGYNKQIALETIEVGGPGYLIVQAGGRIDLGASMGITTVGNLYNPYLSSSGSSLAVGAGLSKLTQDVGVRAFFAALRAAGDEYESLKKAGDSAGAQAILDRVRSQIIDPLGLSWGSGDIVMTASQISTQAGGDLFVVATGTLDVGGTLLGVVRKVDGKTKNTGIFTASGGAVNIFANGDVNVNEARIMTFQGGDITIWSDYGSINAGKGDPAVVSAGTPKYVCNDGRCSIVFTPPALGSGIRAVTYAPAVGVEPPPIGDIYLFAPRGVIDAGEAGISGGRVVLGATAILNSANISFASGAVGLPTASQGVNLGALTGASSMSKGAVSSDTGALAQAQERVASAQPIEDMIVKWIDVKVIGYDLTFGPEDQGTKKDNKK